MSAAAKAGGASGAAGGKGGAKGGGGGQSGVQKGFLNGNGGALYPEGSKEGGGQKTEADALRELLPDQEELRKIAAQTDPNDFMRDLAQFGSVLGLGETGEGMPHFGTPNAHPVLDVSDGPQKGGGGASSSKESAKPTKPTPAA